MNYRTALTELYTPGTAITARATTALTRGQFVAVVAGDDTSHPNVAVCPAGDRPFGLAHLDADTDTLVGIQRGNGRCFRVPATGSITAGAHVEVGADGTATTHTTGEVAGTALHAATDGHVDITLA
ncbi:DUF2190 family protein [Dietzia sp. SLG310A2-38A2]|uniref:capsid cement protein n=1 Tax=Dietzia sp. SLG310A2-38A2 TaxID=1630643 RepID=UPI0015F9CE04|nr:capsid cement protein [Dietzia sp. SLG310A2-38A2]MBB1032553.1 DUF2190 family protein [Dietzia sp. SLG310A2-38A2]